MSPTLGPEERERRLSQGRGPPRGCKIPEAARPHICNFDDPLEQLGDEFEFLIEQEMQIQAADYSQCDQAQVAQVAQEAQVAHVAQVNHVPQMDQMDKENKMKKVSKEKI